MRVNRKVAPMLRNCITFPITSHQKIRSAFVLQLDWGYMSDAYLDYYVKEVPRFFWWEGLGITNARAFRKFLTYHGIEAQAVHRRFIYFPRYKMPGSQIPDRLFFIDDGTVNIYSSKFPGICVNVSFYESRFMYRKLVKHLGFKNLEVLDWV